MKITSILVVLASCLQITEARLGESAKERELNGPPIPTFFFKQDIADYLLVESIPSPDRDVASARCTGPFGPESPKGLCRGDKVIQVTNTFSDQSLATPVGKFWGDCVVLAIPSAGSAGWLKCSITWEFQAGFQNGGPFDIEEQGLFAFGSPERTAAFENPMIGGTARYTKAAGVCKQQRMSGTDFFGSIYSVDMEL